MNSTDHAALLAPSYFIDSDHPAVVEFAMRAIDGAQESRERAVRLYYAVRDQIRYNPYAADMSREAMKASTVAQRGESFCVPKSILLAACARAVGIPSRLGFADVRNHLTSNRLKESMRGNDLFVFHGQTLMYVDGRWSKSTPAFNLSLCQKINILPLEYDGQTDSVFHPFDQAGNRHMEYVRDRGLYDDMPYEAFATAMQQTYGKTFAESAGVRDGSADDFEAEAYAGS
ncbi:MAG: transglutaminase family protein [Pseudomonadales bacterium]|nr:transglutaminase family protein [Pseudomonadales bacterium]MCC6530619.1 transglutaminase family protein [Pseudomonadales bacterium]MCP5331916.1 transglutaminase family protein [Pseudomonadales bacterium]HMW15386.1 transglutaminase family protein [Pseudomonadales bacterium]HMW83590.1 transglutaminase family protein [Pseudomonadales bacterium]